MPRKNERKPTLIPIGGKCNLNSLQMDPQLSLFDSKHGPVTQHEPQFMEDCRNGDINGVVTHAFGILQHYLENEEKYNVPALPGAWEEGQYNVAGAWEICSILNAFICTPEHYSYTIMMEKECSHNHILEFAILSNRIDVLEFLAFLYHSENISIEPISIEHPVYDEKFAIETACALIDIHIKKGVRLCGIETFMCHNKKWKNRKVHEYIMSFIQEEVDHFTASDLATAPLIPDLAHIVQEYNNEHNTTTD
jgi:hypothetical protein